MLRAAPAVVCACLVAGFADVASAAEFKGMEVSVVGAGREAYVSLSDCPAGANIVHGFARPAEDKDYATVTLQFRSTPAFKPGVTAKVSLQDKASAVYATAQTFGEVEAGSVFTCTFSFRLPKAAEPARLYLDQTALDLTGRP